MARDDRASMAADSRGVKDPFRTLGFSNFQLDQLESRRIDSYLQEGERVKAVMHGHIRGIGGALIAATSSRILFLYDISSISYFEDADYGSVSGVSIDRTGYLSSITIVTQSTAYHIDYVNPRQAERFISWVETNVTAAAPRKPATSRRAAPS
jgi:hypothetical protein